MDKMRFLVISFTAVLACTCILVNGCTSYERSAVARYDNFDGYWIGDGSYNQTPKSLPPSGFTSGFIGDGSYNPPPERFVGDRWIGDGSYKDFESQSRYWLAAPGN